MKRLSDSKTEKLVDLIRSRYGGSIDRVLVVGCGSGIEAAILAQSLGAKVIGVDVENNFSPEALSHADLRVGDAMALEFSDGNFDFVYSYHALEHIPDPRKALQEIKRVLKPGGGYCIGTPNRGRLIGYLGSKTATLKQKLMWNMNDWKARLLGKFRNEYGAHAGFTASELQGLLREQFSHVTNITDEYYHSIYRRHSGPLSVLIYTRLSNLLFPSVYFCGVK